MEFPTALFIVSLIVVGFVAIRLFRTEGFQTIDAGLLSTRPKLWWIVEDETNARSWWDFGARNSRKPNRGYLEVALAAANASQSMDFDIVPLIGRDAVKRLIVESGESIATADQMPAKLWRQWAFANVLAAKGGLVMMGDSTLCIGPSFGPLVKSSDAAVFGITAEEPRVIPGMATVPPANWVGWATRPHHPVWDIAAGTWNRVANAGPTAWSAAEARRIGEHIWSMQQVKEPAIFQAAEGGRKADGTQITAEDFLGKQVNPLDPKIAFGDEVVYVPMDGDALVRSYRYSWFVRMSKEQILESNFYWAVLAKSLIR